ncbi:MAG: hypothetical protein M5R36_00245 [Deltaproteobacteria bacterium]|nr:hypothetical protein [Deltaproteobacteria bacterium]
MDIHLGVFLQPPFVPPAAFLLAMILGISVNLPLLLAVAALLGWPSASALFRRNR